MTRRNVYAASRREILDSVLQLVQGGYYWAQTQPILIQAPPKILMASHTSIYRNVLSGAQKRHPTINAFNPWTSTEFRRGDVECALIITAMHLDVRLGWEEFFHALASSMPNALPQTATELLQAINTFWGVDYPTLLAGYVGRNDQHGGNSREDAIVIEE